MDDVTVIGLGAMGTALAGAFLDNGHRTTVWNRSPGKAAPLVRRGAVGATSVTGAVAASPLIVVCLLDYGAVHDVLDPARGTLSGRAIVNLTNGTPEAARRTARWAEENGARYVDGGIMAVPPMIGTPEAFVLYSGSESAFEDHRRTLEHLGTARFLGTDAGLAPLLDLALLAAMYGLFGGFLHAAAMVGTEKIAASAFAGMAVPWLNAMTAELPEMARQIDTGEYAKDVTSNLAMQAVGMDNIVAASATQGVDADLILPMRRLMARRIADGFGGDDIAGLIELLRPR